MVGCPGPVCCSTCARRTRAARCRRCAGSPACSSWAARWARTTTTWRRGCRRPGTCCARRSRSRSRRSGSAWAGSCSPPRSAVRSSRPTTGPEFGPALVAKRDVSAGDPLFGPVPFTPDVLQWHWDEITELPAGATLLASSSRYANQAFRVGEDARGACSSTSRRRRRWCGRWADVRPGPAGRRGLGRRRRAGPLGPGRGARRPRGGLAAVRGPLRRTRARALLIRAPSAAERRDWLDRWRRPSGGCCGWPGSASPTPSGPTPCSGRHRTASACGPSATSPPTPRRGRDRLRARPGRRPRPRAARAVPESGRTPDLLAALLRRTPVPARAGWSRCSARAPRSATTWPRTRDWTCSTTTARLTAARRPARPRPAADAGRGRRRPRRPADRAPRGSAADGTGAATWSPPCGRPTAASCSCWPAATWPATVGVDEVGRAAGRPRRRARCRPALAVARRRAAAPDAAPGRLAVIGDGQVRRPRAELRLRRRRRVRRRAGAATPRRAERRRAPAAWPRLMRICRRGGLARSTPTCARRASTARWSAPLDGHRPTTSGGPRPGSSRRCSRPGRWPATPTLGAAYVERRRAAGVDRRRTGRTSSPTCRRCAAGSRTHMPAGRRRPASSSSAAGGLRDVEFAVQLLQLVHGRTDAALRLGRHAARRWTALAAGGYVGPRRRREAGRVLPVPAPVEHRLQLQRLRRTHLLPAERRQRGLRWLARALGCGRTRRGDAVGVLVAEWRRARRARSAGCTRSCSTGRCCDAVARLPSDAAAALPERRPATGWARSASPTRRARCGTSRALTGGVSPARRRSSGRCCRCCSTSSPTRRTRTAGCWPTGGCPRRSATRPGTCGCCATRAWSPSGWRSCSAPPVRRRPARAGARRCCGCSADDAELRARGRPTRCGPRSRRRRPRGTRTRTAAVGAARSLRRQRAAPDRRAPTCSGCSTSAEVGAALTDVVGGHGRRRRCDAAVAYGRAGPRRAMPTRVAVIGDGPARRRARLGYGSRRRRAVRARAAARGRRAGGRRAAANAVVDELRRLLGCPRPDPPLRGRRRPAAGGAQRAAGPHARRPTGRTTRAGPRRGRRRRCCGPRRWPATRRSAPAFVELVDPIRYPVDGLTAGRGDRDPPDQGAGRRRAAAARRRPGHAHQARPRRARRRRVDGAAAAAAARRARCRSCAPPGRWTALAAAGEAGLLAADDAAALRGGLEDGDPGPQRGDAGARQAGGPAARGAGRSWPAVAAGGRLPAGRDPGEFLDDYRRATRRARAVVERVFYG